MYYGILVELQRFSQHDSQLGTHADCVRQLESTICFIHTADRFLVKHESSFIYIYWLRTCNVRWLLLQDLFTVALGWLLFGGLPFDVV